MKRDKSIRYKMSEHNIIMVQIKRKIIDILHRVMDIQNDLRLTSFLIEFSKADQEMIMNPTASSQELQYLNNILNGVVEETKENEDMKRKCDEKLINWMMISYYNRQLDMRHKSVKKDLICILLDIILYQDTLMVNSAFTLLTRYFSQKNAIIEYANEVQLL